MSSPESTAVSEATSSWHAVRAADVPGEARVRSVTVDGRSLALTRCGGTLGALDNHCPHQGGPLGEGSIEKGLLRCPWHGYDYDPLTGRPPGEFADTVTSYDVEERDDGVYVRLPERVQVDRTVADVLVETLVAHGVTQVFGMVGHSNLGFADALRRAEERGELALHRHPARGCGGVRRQCLRQADRAAGCVLRDRRARARPTC